MSSIQRTVLEVVVGLTLLLGGYAWWRNDVRQHAVIDFKLHTVDSTAKVLSKTADSVGAVALSAASEAERQKARALALVEQGKAAQAKADSLVRVSANERERAERILRDSLATAAELRAALGRSIAQSRADSGAFQSALGLATRTQALLLATLTADSVSLAAERSHSRSLENLNASLRSEAKLLRDQQPSKVGQIAKYVGWAGAGFALGHFVK